MKIRDAEEADLPSILAIYNHEILHSTSVYTIEPVDLANRLTWLTQRRAAGFPVFVAEDHGTIVGFASFGEWRSWPGYLHTVEHSVYVTEEARGRGIGRTLLEALIKRARADDKHVMIGGVDAENAASLALHEALGFTRAGHFREVGRKFDRWLDLVFVELRI